MGQSTAYLRMVQSVTELVNECTTIKEVQELLSGLSATVTGISQTKAQKIAQEVEPVPQEAETVRQFRTIETKEDK